MIGAAWIAAARGLLPEAARAEIVAGVDGLGRRPPVSDLDEDAILDAVGRDKKARAGRVPFVLPTRIGEVVVEPQVTADEIRAALRRMERARRRPAQPDDARWGGGGAATSVSVRSASGRICAESKSNRTEPGRRIVISVPVVSAFRRLRR